MTELVAEKDFIKGKSKATIEKIINGGILTVEDLAREIPVKLAERAGIGDSTAEEAIKEAIRMIDRGYITGKQLHDEMQSRTRLTTGSREVDALLGGGLESETTTEVIGSNAIGKTQLMHMLAVNAQLPLEEGGLDGKVVWVDTEDTFRPDRIKQICMARGYDYEKFLSGILVAKAFNSRHQQVLIENLNAECKRNNVKLVIVDSMIAHLRGEYLGRGTLAGRQNVLGDMLQELGKLVQSQRITVVYTNQVMDDPSVMYGRSEKATGGNIMGHAATTRIHIRKGRKTIRIAELVKSPYLPWGQAPFIIDEYGVRDTEGNRDETEES